MKEKFRKFLPVVVDMETGGFDPVNDALLEIAITLIDYDKEFRVGTTHRHHIIPFEGLNVSEESLEFTGIDLNHPLRNAVDEKEALKDQKKKRKIMYLKGVSLFLVSFYRVVRFGRGCDGGETVFAMVYGMHFQ